MSEKKGYWWCESCHCEVDPSDVTYDEHHSGYYGCGAVVEWVKKIIPTAKARELHERIKQYYKKSNNTDNPNQHALWLISSYLLGAYTKGAKDAEKKEFVSDKARELAEQLPLRNECTDELNEKNIEYSANLIQSALEVHANAKVEAAAERWCQECREKAGCCFDGGIPGAKPCRVRTAILDKEGD